MDDVEDEDEDTSDKHDTMLSNEKLGNAKVGQKRKHPEDAENEIEEEVDEEEEGEDDVADPDDILLGGEGLFSTLLEEDTHIPAMNAQKSHRSKRKQSRHKLNETIQGQLRGLDLLNGIMGPNQLDKIGLNVLPVLEILHGTLGSATKRSETIGAESAKHFVRKLGNFLQNFGSCHVPQIDCWLSTESDCDKDNVCLTIQSRLRDTTYRILTEALKPISKNGVNVLNEATAGIFLFIFKLETKLLEHCQRNHGLSHIMGIVKNNIGSFTVLENVEETEVDDDLQKSSDRDIKLSNSGHVATDILSFALLKWTSKGHLSLSNHFFRKILASGPELFKFVPFITALKNCKKTFVRRECFSIFSAVVAHRFYRHHSEQHCLDEKRDSTGPCVCKSAPIELQMALALQYDQEKTSDVILNEMQKHALLQQRESCVHAFEKDCTKRWMEVCEEKLLESRSWKKDATTEEPIGVEGKQLFSSKAQRAAYQKELKGTIQKAKHALLRYSGAENE